MSTATVESCKSGQLLLSRVHADFRVYLEAVNGLEELAFDPDNDQDFNKLLRDVRIAHDAFIAARKRMNDHISAHGCNHTLIQT